MRTISKFFLIAPLAILFAVMLGVRESPRAIADDKPKEAPPRLESLGQAYECTAIGEVIKANNGKVPKNGTELMKALAKLGDFAQLPVPFSAVALDSGITHPRVVIAPRPGRAAPKIGEEENDPADCKNMPNMPAQVVIAPNPLSPAKVTEPHVEGRLFLAANMDAEVGKSPKVKTIEFISWNSRKKKFDFGVIDCGGEQPEIKLLDGVRCFTCHKNQGPILGQGPWSNTTNNDHVRAAALAAIDPNPNANDPDDPPALFGGLGKPFGQGGFNAARSPILNVAQKERTTFDGMSLVAGEPEVCDFAIRLGGEIVRDREIYKAMAKTADGRRALVLLLSSIATPQPTVEVARQVNATFSNTYPNFANEVVSLNKLYSSTLVDFSPSGSIGTLQTITTRQPAAWGSGSTQRTNTILTFSGNPRTITDYNRRRTTGDHGMPSNRLPSNPRSFIRTPIPFPLRPSLAVNPVDLTRMIGLTEGDRQFMAKALADLAGSIKKPKVTAITLAKDVFNSAAFSEVLKAGNIPDREDFKDRFVEGLKLVAKDHSVEEPRFARGDYASGPSCTPVGGIVEREPAIVPTTACLRCHDVHTGTKPSAFNPIPMLAFDPFDKTGREKWVKDSDAKKRAQILARMLKRLGTDKDMPPEDSAEYEQFRQKNPAAFDAMKDWLDAELKKAKGN